MKLNLEAKTPAEQKVKAYLEANASEVLARKINEGAKIVKNGKTLLNKKTLAGFMKFTCDEAKKQAEKGAQSACIEDVIVYSWAVHYFEEDSIEGTLYNEDGTVYKAPMPKSTPLSTKYEPPKPKPKPQMSIFDMMAADEQKQPADEPDDEPTDEDYAEAEEATQTPPTPARPRDSPVWQRYVKLEQAKSSTNSPKRRCKNLTATSTKRCPTHPVTDTKNTASMPQDENEPDMSAFDMDALCILSELFGNELELR